MFRKIMLQELPDFDVIDYLNNEQATAMFLTAVIEDGDLSLLVAALGDIARARGMSDFAREALYKALRADSQPRFDTILRYGHPAVRDDAMKNVVQSEVLAGNRTC